MKRFLILAVFVAVSAAQGATRVSSSTVDALSVDLRMDAVREVVVSATDLHAFAYNNTADWVSGGDPARAIPSIRITDMNPCDEPERPSAWTAGAIVATLAGTLAEGVSTWAPVGRSYFRAELLVGDMVLETGYFDFSECTDPGLKTSVFAMTVPEESIRLDSVGGEIRVTATVTEGGRTLVEGVDYTLSVDETPEPGVACDVTVTGIGDYYGTLVKTFVPKAIRMGHAACGGLACDTRADQPRRPLTRREILPFVYDTSWWQGASAIESLTVTPVVDGEIVLARQVSLPVTNIVGTARWKPDRQLLYQAEIRTDLGFAWTNLIDCTHIVFPRGCVISIR